MVESKRETWHEIVKRAEDAGADGLELNFGCPHGMSERGMGAAVGQVPDYACQITEWVKEVAKTPVIVKLTPNVTDIIYPARAAKKGGADAVSLINTINSITGVDLDTFAPRPDVGGRSAHGGYCGPAVKPIALNMVVVGGQDRRRAACRSRGIGGISNWRDAAEFMLLGCHHRAGVHRGHALRLPHRRGHDRRALELPRREGLPLGERAASGARCRGVEVGGARSQLQDHRQHRSAEVHRLRALLRGLQRRRAPVDRARGPSTGAPHVEILEDTCVGCNLCTLVCPVDGCISMMRVDTGRPPLTWKELSGGPGGAQAPRSAQRALE